MADMHQQDNFRHYVNAPITEAILDIQVDPSVATQEIFNLIAEENLDTYPDKQERSQTNFELDLSAPENTKVETWSTPNLESMQ